VNISVTIITLNEADRVAEALASVAWADEMIVVDAGSTDRTIEIARQYTDRVMQRPWAGYRDQKAFAHSQATQQWVMLVDSDERVTPELRGEIQRTLAGEGGRYMGYAVPRLVFYLGRWWRRGSQASWRRGGSGAGSSGFRR